MNRNKKEERIGETRINKQGCLMEFIKYNNLRDIVVRFQDKYKADVHTDYDNFKSGIVKNPYSPSIYGVGITGNKYQSRVNGTIVKEYKTWYDMIKRCYDNKYKRENPTYKNVICCEEWLLYENFYEWLHSQENFNKWLIEDRYAIDKDILVKNNQIYSSETCCLVPQSVNSLFIRCGNVRGDLPIGVVRLKNGFRANCKNPFTNKHEYIGIYSTIEDAFLSYKQYKEDLIRQMAKIEYEVGNITRVCYDAMMNYKVEITD